MRIQGFPGVIRPSLLRVQPAARSSGDGSSARQHEQPPRALPKQACLVPVSVEGLELPQLEGPPVAWLQPGSVTPARFYGYHLQILGSQYVPGSLVKAHA